MPERDVSHYDELFPGRFVKSGLLKGQKVTRTIAKAVVDELPDDDGNAKVKGIIRFSDAKLELVLNKTNGDCIRAMFGDSLANWVGKRVTLFPTETKMGKDAVPCIRVWGSPDIAADFEISIKLPRKKPFKMTMHKTVLGKEASLPSPTEATPAPANTESAGPQEQKMPTIKDLRQKIEHWMAIDAQAAKSWLIESGYSGLAGSPIRAWTKEECESVLNALQEVGAPQ